MQIEQYKLDLEREYREAAALYVATGQLQLACQAHAKIGDTHSLVELIRSCRTRELLSSVQKQVQESLKGHQPALESERKSFKDCEVSAALRCAARALEKTSHVNFAKEALLTLGDKVGILEILIRAGRWEEALSRAGQVRATH